MLSRGGPKSLLLHTDHRRYLFNCGEGTQRLTSQLALSRTLAQLEHVFITSKSWQNLGGLPGMCLSARFDKFSKYRIPCKLALSKYQQL